MFSLLKQRRKPKVIPMNIISIHKKSIYHNLELLQKLQPQAVFFPVLKSNAYGHGLKEMVKILRTTDVPYLAVDSFPEYQIVKQHSDKAILLLGETLLENYPKYDTKRTTFCVYNLGTIRALGKINKPIKIHLFLNTGMQREGIQEDQLSSILEELHKYPKLHLEGVLSHFHSADEDKSKSIQEQITIFKKLYHAIVDAGFTPIYKHIGNSAGIGVVEDVFFNAYRPGLAMYGYNPFDSGHPQYQQFAKLRPALSITSRVISSQLAWPGDGVSYGHTHKVHDRMILATIPFGYAEGLPRSASGKITVYMGRRQLKQVGTICMNLCTCTCEGDALIDIGTKVEVISPNHKDAHSIEALATASDTIVYECLVRLDK
jgi:alanine racemase